MSSKRLHQNEAPITRSVSLPRRRLRAIAKCLLELSPPIQLSRTEPDLIKLVCISDTHNTQPPLPPGDVLLHAGDLTEWGSFDELQAQITWLSSQPHQHKVIIAGNHDVLFDPEFLNANKERYPVEPGKTAADLDMKGIIYLEDSTVALDVTSNEGRASRTVKIYGCPHTPQYTSSAFQVQRDEDHWNRKVPQGIDILLTHGPPWSHLDGQLRRGCQFLAREVAHVRPRLVVFGHIHVGYGREIVRFDRARRVYEGIEGAWRGWEAIPSMVLSVLWMRLMVWVRERLWGGPKADLITEMINAAVVGGEETGAASVTCI